MAVGFGTITNRTGILGTASETMSDKGNILSYEGVAKQFEGAAMAVACEALAGENAAMTSAGESGVGVGTPLPPRALLRRPPPLNARRGGILQAWVGSRPGQID